MTTNEYMILRLAVMGLSRSVSKGTIRTVRGEWFAKDFAKLSKDCRKAIELAVKMAQKLFLTKRAMVVGVNKKIRVSIERELRRAKSKNGAKQFIFENLIAYFEQRKKATKEFRKNSKTSSGKFSSSGERTSEERAAAEHDQRMQTDVPYQQEHRFWTENDTRIGGR